MKTSLSIVLAFVFQLLGCHGGTNSLPGLRFEVGASRLSGNLVFLYCTNWQWSGGVARIYEFNLETETLRVITDCPSGDFYAARDGATFCVLHGANVGWGIFGTNAFIYSDRLRLSRAYTFDKHASKVTFGQDDVYFHFDSRVRRYDIRKGFLDSELNASQAEASVQDNLAGYGGFQAPDGRWIFFDGTDAPLRGTKLVSSRFDEFETRIKDPKGSNVRILTHFSKPLRGSYNLTQLSPCGRFAFVRKSVPINDGWGYTYYVVSLKDGKMRVAVADTVARMGASKMSQIYWVK